MILTGKEIFNSQKMVQLQLNHLWRSRLIQIVIIIA